MKRPYILILLTGIVLFSACKEQTDAEKLSELKNQRKELDKQITDLESKLNASKVEKATPVSVLTIKKAPFNGFIDVQAQVIGDQNVTAYSQAPGIVTGVNVKVGQLVSKGAVLAGLNTDVLDRQIAAIMPQLTLSKTIYEKQKKLKEKEVVSEVQFLQAEAQYKSLQEQKLALEEQKEMYYIKSPINGTVDQINVKEGDITGPGVPGSGIRVVNSAKLKAEANLGENYLGKVKKGDKATIVLTDINDTIQATISYVAQAVDPISRSFLVEVELPSNQNLHPNMSSRMRILNYTNEAAIVIPVNIIQNTSEGQMIFVEEGKKAKSIIITTGKTSDGMIEVVSGLKEGDKVVVIGYEELENKQPVEVK